MNEPTIDLPYPLLDHANQSIGERALRVPAQMILQIASGLDTPEEIAIRYGYDDEAFTALKAWTPFVQEVAKVRAELEKSGFDFTLDARLKAKELSNAVFLRAMKDDATFGQVHDAMRTFVEFGDLKPKNTTAPGTPGAPGTNPGFSIKIVFNGTQPPPHSVPVIDITPDVDTPARLASHNPFALVTHDD